MSKKEPYFLTLITALTLFAAGCCCTHHNSEKADPVVHWGAEQFAGVSKAIEENSATNAVPGGVLFVYKEGTYTNSLKGKEGKYCMSFESAYGMKSLVPTEETNSVDTIYDMASLTKVLATTPSVMLLWERGLIDIDAPASTYLPLFQAPEQKAITVRHLMTHTSGLRPGIGTKGWKGYEGGIKTACKELPKQAPGSKFVYSDINFILLGEIVRQVSGKRIDEFAEENVYIPLGMVDTSYNPSTNLVARIAPTQQRETGMLRGQVHDPVANNMDGVAGHAGLFSTADDISIYCAMLLHEGRYGEGLKKQFFKPETVKFMTSVQSPKELEDKRGLGWDIDTGYSSPRGNVYPAGDSFGHTGFTGTMFWILPKEGTYYIFLSNRVHPEGKGGTLSLYRGIASQIATIEPVFKEGCSKK